jgi:uncharacterized repeat protein (TIGR01451 family)
MASPLEALAVTFFERRRPVHGRARRVRPTLEALEDRLLLSGVIYNENVSGDLSNNQSAPTALTLGLGTNSIIGNVGTGDNQDWITLHVPSGLNLSSLVLASYVSSDTQGFIGVQRGTSFVGNPETAPPYLGYSHFGTGAQNGSLPPTNLVGANLLPIMGDSSVEFGSQGFTPPLSSGDYTFLIQQQGSTTAYQFDFDTTSATAPSPDLTIAKSHTGIFHRGDTSDTYTLNVSNVGAGPTTATVTVTDTLPTGLAPTAADSGTVNGWSLSTSGQTITATRGDALAAGQSYPSLTLTVSVAGNAPGNVTNTATVAGGGEVNTANDSASDPTTITDVADLTISKSHTGNFKQGDRADSYTLTVSNIGQGPTVGAVTVTDTLPVGLAPTAADTSTVSGWSLSTSGQTITATRSDTLTGGTSYPPLALTVSVSATAPASVTNNATVAGGGELNTGNDSTSDPTTITQVADLTIAKSHAGTFHAGDSADTYTIAVRNIGAAPTDGSTVTVIDTLPIGLAPTAADSGTVSGWAVSFSGQTVTATRRDVLNAGASYPPLIVTVSVANSVASLVTNSASVAGGGEVITTNDTASDPTATTAVADLTINKSHTGNFKQGDAADVYTLNVSNIGPVATAGTVTVTDILPAGLAPTSADIGTKNGWTIAFSGQTVTATRADVLAGGGNYSPLVITVRVTNDAQATLTNSATVAGGGELNTANDTASDVTAITQVADLTVAANHSGNISTGTTDAYTITVSNTGRGVTSAPVTVIDTLPAGLTYAGSAIVNGWTVSVSGQSVTATRGDMLAGGASYPPLTLIVQVSSTAQPGVTNTVTVSGGGEVNLTNDAASDVTTIVAGGAIRRRRGA